VASFRVRPQLQKRLKLRHIEAGEIQIEAKFLNLLQLQPRRREEMSTPAPYTDPPPYVAAVLVLYVELPETPLRVSLQEQ
jgi:hypothetical protein